MTIKEIKEFTIQQKNGWKLFHWIFLYTLIPAIWMFVRVFIVANRLSANVDTYVQWDYVNVLLEVVQDTILMPLFWWFGRIIVSKDEDMNKVREVYMVAFIAYFILIMLLTFFVNDFIKMIGGNENSEKTFFTLQLWSKVPSILTTVSIIVLLNSRMYKGFLFLLIMKLTCLITFDFTLTNGDVFTNNYVGLGLSSILSETFVFGASLFLVAKNFGILRFFNLKTFHFNPIKWRFNKAFFFNSGSVFLYSFINNAFYLFMMAKNMNIASGSSAYWVANGIIWNWILMTSIIILSIQKSIVSTAGPITNRHRTFIITEFQIVAAIGLLLSLAIFIPLYYPMIGAMGITSPLKEESWKLFAILIGFFIFHVSGQSIIAQFVSEGKNWTITLHSIIVNIIIYVPVIILNATGDMDLTDSSVLAYMFGFTLISSWVVAVAFAIWSIWKGKKQEQLQQVEKPIILQNEL